jgi:ABC-type uncharacterized transport system permease subunit
MKTYDSNKVVVIFGGVELTGFAPDSKVSVARNTDAFTLQMGVDGKGTRSKTNDRSGRFTVQLMQTSESNAILQAFATADELNNAGVLPMLVKDLGGATLHAAQQAWVVKQPDSAFNAEAEAREWVFETDVLDMFEGGN